MKYELNGGKKHFKKITLFPIVNWTFPHCFTKHGAEPHSSSYKLSLLDSGPYYSYTSLCQRASCTVDRCLNPDTLRVPNVLLLTSPLKLSSSSGL